MKISSSGTLGKEDIEKLKTFQKNEITEHMIYLKLAESSKIKKNNKVLLGLAKDEMKHYLLLKKYTGLEMKPDRLKVWWYLFLSRVLGITFGIKLMENGEESAESAYRSLSQSIHGLMKIARDEDRHEKALVRMISEDRLKYTGSIVLGLNDALVELTGALAGFTFALQDSRLIAAVGLITGVAASLSMAASEYLSTKTEAEGRSPLKAAVYTGFAYLLTVGALIFPFLVFGNVFLSIISTVLIALSIIVAFTLYISVVRETPFWKRFLEMAAISLGVATLSFLIGVLLRNFIGT
ncbi:MAG: VIT1/CCC1 transporter family protein [Candidatus Aenigmarchaeota archaeon]|nr:VIT1/CCC1 transporter family protein [Candidatus Aenigmarchaeota archaeon]